MTTVGRSCRNVSQLERAFVIESDSGGGTVLSLEHGVLLAHALVQRVADVAALRVIFIKGPVANLHELRAHHVSSDVDVLVRPEQVEHLVSQLIDLGWRRRPESFAHKSFVTHSTTLMNDKWPCDIDIHFSYPGMLGDERTSFDVLFDRHIDIELAGYAITAADFTSSALLAALHALRAPYLSRNQAEFEQVVAAVRNRTAERPTLVEDLFALALRLCAQEPLSPFFREFDIVVEPTGSPSAKMLAWVRASSQLNRSTNWLAMIADARPADRVALVARALFPSRRDLEVDHPYAASGPLAALNARIDRFLRAVRSLPIAVKIVRQEQVAKKIAAEPSITSEAATSPADEPPPREGRATVQPVIESPPIGRSLSTDRAHHLYRRTDLVAVAEAAGGILVLPLGDLSRADPLKLTGVAVFVWHHLADPVSFAGLTRAAVDGYDVNEAVAAHDIGSFLDELSQRDLLDIATRR